MISPHVWQIIKITKPDSDLDSDKEKVIYKVFAGWLGDYTTGGNWRLNSGISSYKQDSTHVYFIGYSGSVYQCGIGQERMTAYMYDVYCSLMANAEAKGAIVEPLTYIDFKREFNNDLQ